MRRMATVEEAVARLPTEKIVTGYRDYYQISKEIYGGKAVNPDLNYEERFAYSILKGWPQVNEAKRNQPPLLEGQDRIVVMIPCHYLEPKIGDTLAKYRLAVADARARGTQVEFIVLVNGSYRKLTESLDISQTESYQQVEAFMHSETEMPITLLGMNYQDNQVKIGRIRGDISRFALSQLAAEGYSFEDLQRIYFLTHDADLVKIKRGAFSRMSKVFRENPGVEVITGKINYPEQDLYNDHILFTIQKFTEFIELYAKYYENYIIPRGGNTAFRASSYVLAGGHQNRPKGENRPIVNVIQDRKSEDPEVIAQLRPASPSIRYPLDYDIGMGIVTSPRRQRMARANNVPQAQRYDNFGEKGDLMDDYLVSVDNTVIPHTESKVSDSRFKEELEAEIHYMYAFQLVTRMRQYVRVRDQMTRLTERGETPRKVDNRTPELVYSQFHNLASVALMHLNLQIEVEAPEDFLNQLYLESFVPADDEEAMGAIEYVLSAMRLRITEESFNKYKRMMIRQHYT